MAPFSPSIIVYLPIATSQLARFTFYPIMSSGDPSTSHSSTLSSASGTVPKGSKLDKAIQDACEVIEPNFKAEYDDEVIIRRLSTVWINVHDVVQASGDLDLNDRFRNMSEFKSYVTPGSDEERKLINLLRRMTEKQVPWENLFLNGTSLSSL